ncbi:hypothetical protein [Opitutus terrae]|uniref:SHOCT domain-containing protein n=1 Tax=Opitutus terrae (strain DSM 11246 / JCM 15787 / PB90-1) TaxID=452637 RepID=B1ZRC8_OPITP|nr:hypothetical protein [Opitutus terrae]ACB74615.1 hypothetical protein Oter_1330 [Opitutus terrae PB90-1]
MNTTAVRRLVLVLGLWWLGGATMAHAASAKSAPVPAGDDTYRITREADTVFARSTTPLRYEAEGDAAKFCADQGKRLKVLSIDEEKGSLVRGGFSRVTLVFKALSPGDPELANEPYRGEAAANETPGEQAARYQRMLDELHTAGILSDKEFKAATKRMDKGGK